jgi:hypothetical protein
MRFRYKIDELRNKESREYLSDLQLLRAVVAERKSDVSNVYAPLSVRLSELYKKLDDLINSGVGELPEPKKKV